MKILIVDDEEMIRAVLREYIEFEGGEADEACDGMEAVKMCHSHGRDDAAPRRIFCRKGDQEVQADARHYAFCTRRGI